MKIPALRRLALLPAVLLLHGCGSTTQGTVFIHPLADLTIIQRIAVMPLENLATLANAGEWVRQILTNELRAQGLFDVVEPWEVNRALVERNLVEVNELSPQELSELAQGLDCQALLLGTVLQFERARVGTVSSPELGLSLRLIDAETGLVIWSATDSRAGVAFGNRLVGMDGPDLTAATSELVRSLIDTLAP